MMEICNCIKEILKAIDGKTKWDELYMWLKDLEGEICNEANL